VSTEPTPPPLVTVDDLTARLRRGPLDPVLAERAITATTAACAAAVPLVPEHQPVILVLAAESYLRGSVRMTPDVDRALRVLGDTAYPWLASTPLVPARFQPGWGVGIPGG